MVRQISYNGDTNTLKLQCPNKIYADKVNNLIKQAGIAVNMEWGYLILPTPNPADTGRISAGNNVNKERSHLVAAPNSSGGLTNLPPDENKQILYKKYNPNFKNQKELENCINASQYNNAKLHACDNGNHTQLNNPKSVSIDVKQPITEMPNKYGKEGMANLILNNSKIWAYPNDKQKASEEIPINCQDGSKLNYTLIRGKITKDADGIGQLTTTHYKTMNATTSLRQEQDCQLMFDEAIC